MFYKIDPTRGQTPFDLGADGFLLGDRVWVHLQGDFQPTPRGHSATDTFRNTSFEIGSKAFKADPAAVLTMRDTTLLAITHDDPLGDNTDPDNDYGVRVKLEMFTDRGDHFDFRGRDALPEVHGSRYKSGDGNDVIVMSDTKVQGFNTAKTFVTGAGNDRVVAGDLNLKIAFGDGTDTFAVKGASVVWGNKENRDNDDTIVIKTDDGHHRVVNAEILKDGGDKDLLVKWYFNVARDDDGDLTVKFFENGKLVATGDGFYDEALPTPTGEFQAIFRKGGGLGERIELSGIDGFDDLVIHRGGDGGDAETDIVTSGAFLNTVFDHIGDTYDLTGKPMPWDHGSLEPLVPVTVAIRGQVGQPFLKAQDLVADDRGNSIVRPEFELKNAGDIPGMEYKAVEVFFKASGSAEQGKDWTFKGSTAYDGDDFASGVLRHGADANGDQIYSVMLRSGRESVAVPIKIIGDHKDEGNEKIKITVVDIDLWKDGDSGPELYRLSGGPGNDKEHDYDGPTGLESHLVHDSTFIVTIQDDLVS